jgi:hypothetical protein
LQTDHKHIADQVRANILGSAAHVVLLEASDSLANSGFNFALGFHDGDGKVLDDA